MKTAHTPGPWTLANSRVYLGPFDLIGIGLPERTEPGNWENDSRLIAAAPELLEACKSLEEIATLINARQHANAPLRAEDWSELFYSCGKARAAISKAEGN